MFDYDAECAERLFRAIVTEALIDACLPDQPYSTRPPKKRRLEGETDEEYAERMAAIVAYRKVSADFPRTDARAWLTGGGKYFGSVCEMAGYDPDDIRERAEGLAKRGWVWGEAA